MRGSILGYATEAYDPDSCWYAVWTRSKQEKAAAVILSRLGVRHYLPLRSELRQWSDRRQKIEVPLFSGYLFVHLNPLKDTRLKVLRVPGVVAFVGNQTGPLPIPHKEIEDIQAVLASGTDCSVQPSLKEGDRVRVVRGPLAGVEGTLVRANSESRLFISIDMIRQSLVVSIASDDVELVCADRAGILHPRLSGVV
jgi:transcription termination/antitermination protein NusG